MPVTELNLDRKICGTVEYVHEAITIEQSAYELEKAIALEE